MDKAIQEVVDCIVNSQEYQDCLSIKKKMNINEELTSKIAQIKRLQKEYLKTNSIQVENDLQKLESEINQIPIYVMYNQKLEVVNEMITYVNEELIDYFYTLLNTENY